MRDVDDDLKEVLSKDPDLPNIIKEIIKDDDDLKNILKNKLLSKTKDAIEYIIEDMDDDEDLKEAISINFNLSDIIKEVAKDDDDLKNILKSRIKKVLIEKIKNIEDCDDLEDFLAGTWNDELVNSFDTSEILKELIKEDDKLKVELKKKIKELIISDFENIDEDYLPSMNDVLKQLDFNEALQEVLSDRETKDNFNNSIKTLIKKRINDELTTEDLPDNLLDGDFISDHVQNIMRDPSFQVDFEKSLNTSLKKIIFDMTKSNNHDFEVMIKEHHQIKNIVQSHTNELLENDVFLDNVRRLLLNQLTEIINSPNLHKTMINIIINKLTEQLINRMFQVPK
jgi:hypothetical protein